MAEIKSIKDLKREIDIQIELMKKARDKFSINEVGYDKWDQQILLLENFVKKVLINSFEAELWKLHDLGLADADTIKLILGEPIGLQKVDAEMKLNVHMRKHNELHKALDELTGDYIRITGKLPGATNILELMEWSNRQRVNPEN